MINEFRTYQLKVGGLATYLDAFERIALPLIHQHMLLLGFWTADTGKLNCVHHLWAFEDAIRREQRFAALRAEPGYRDEFLPIAAPLIVQMHSQLLQPAGFMEGLPLAQVHAQLAPNG